MLVNALLNGIADTFAQGLSAARARARTAPSAAAAKKDRVSIEIHDLGEKPLPTHRHYTAAAAATFDVDRMVRYMTWGMHHGRSSQTAIVVLVNCAMF